MSSKIVLLLSVGAVLLFQHEGTCQSYYDYATSEYEIESPESYSTEDDGVSEGVIEVFGGKPRDACGPIHEFIRFKQYNGGVLYPDSGPFFLELKGPKLEAVWSSKQDSRILYTNYLLHAKEVHCITSKRSPKLRIRQILGTLYVTYYVNGLPMPVHMCKVLTNAEREVQNPSECRLGSPFAIDWDAPAHNSFWAWRLEDGDWKQNEMYICLIDGICAWEYEEYINLAAVNKQTAPVGYSHSELIL